MEKLEDKVMEQPESSFEKAAQNNEENELAAAHPVIAAKYHSLMHIATGAQGTMLSGVDAQGVKVAIKVCDLSAVGSLKDMELFEREIKAIRNLNIEGIPRYIETLKSDRYIYLVEEYVSSPSLQKRLRDGVRYTFDEILTIMKNAARILAELSKRVPPVIHRDIKPANLMVGDDLSVHLVDFGVVAAISKTTLASMTFAGTVGYFAPEQLYGRATPAADVFSLGVTCLEMASGIAPDKMEMNGLEYDVEHILPQNLPKWFVNVIRSMVAADPTKRLKDGQALLDALVREDSLQSDINMNSELYKSGEASEETNDGEICLKEPSCLANYSDTNRIKSSELVLHRKNENYILGDTSRLMIAYCACLCAVPIVNKAVDFFVSILKVFLWRFGYFSGTIINLWTSLTVSPLVYAIFSVIIYKLTRQYQKTNYGNTQTYKESAIKINRAYFHRLTLNQQVGANAHYCAALDSRLNIDVLKELQAKLDTPQNFSKEEVKPLTAGEVERLDNLINTKDVVYPCLEFVPESNKTEVHRKFSKLGLIFTVLFAIYAGVTVISLLSYVFGVDDLRYYSDIIHLTALKTVILGSFIAVIAFIGCLIRFWKNYKALNHRHEDPRNSEVNHLFKRAFLDKCRKTRENITKDNKDNS